MDTLLCYNKGCAKNFTEEENAEDVCVYHPGVPVFHDALKGWSCCKRRTTDFSDFLNIPGCTKGRHSNVKPEPIQPQVKTSKTNKNNIKREPQLIIQKSKIQPMERPSIKEKMVPLNLKTTQSLKQALENLRIKIESEDDKSTLKGKTCKNSGCGQVYQGDHSNLETCTYHPGGPVFHEGMKYWSCCNRKTSDFSAFLAQEGCETGLHEWKSSGPVFTTCRYDWHQTGQTVVISVYAKASDPEKCSFTCNKVSVDIAISFQEGNEFKLSLELFGIINPEKSHVTISGTKVEITLRKGEPISWGALESFDSKPKISIDSEKQETEKKDDDCTEKKTQSKEDSDDDSDLDGIEDTEFD